MKKIITNLCFLLFALSLNATIRTVSNSPTTLAQYNSIQAAVDASANGDTVYIHASGVGYSGASINNKKIALIGPGWAPDTDPGSIATVYGVISLNGTCNNSLIQGIYFAGNNQNLNNGGGGLIFSNDLTGISILRNAFSGGSHVYVPCDTYTFTNLLIEGNYFKGTTVGVRHNCGCCNPNRPIWTDVLVINNVFVESAGLALMNNSTNVHIDHNLFYGSPSYPFEEARYFLITNNIFIQKNFTVLTFDYCTFNNNLTFNSYGGNNTPWLMGNNTGSNNISNTDPQMVDQISINNGVSNPLLNFTISAGPANDAGTDGKDLGLLFDLTGYLNWSNSRNPKLPVVNSLLINSTANPGGNLEIHLNASQAK